MRPNSNSLALAALCVLAAGTAQAQTPAVPTSAEAPTHRWQAAVPRLTASAYFTNLKDGDTIETPYVLKFGLSGGWGLAPIAQAGRARSGHHHLLINRDLPLNFKEALPFNDQYLHFGKGQMQTVLTLAPGTYTLRMLLADQRHLPHFVYSKPTRITVTKALGAAAAPPPPGIGLMLPAGASTQAPFVVQFHASGLNVGHLAQRLKDSGHFRLTLSRREGGAPEVLRFPEGQTEVWLAPPPGRYKLQLDMVDNLDPERLLAPAATASILVL
jgi:hypothetical protein